MKNFLIRNKKFILTIKLIFGLSILLTIYFSIEDKQGLYIAFKNANVVNLSIAFLLIFVNILLQFLKYNKLLSASGVKLKRKKVFESLIFGFSLGFVTPGNIGELGRAVYFNDVNRWQASGAVFVDKLINMISVYLVGSLTLIILMLHYSKTPFFFTVLYISIFIISFFLFIFFIWNPYFFFYLSKKLKFKYNIQKRVLTIVKAVNNIPTPSLLYSMFIALLWLGVIVLQYHMVMLGFTNISVKASLLAIPSMLMIKMALPITIGDLGIREGALMFCYSFFTGNKEIIIYSGLIILVFNMILPAIAGGFLLKNVSLNKNFKKSES